MPISYDYIHTNFLHTSESTTVAEILQRILTIPQQNRRDLYLLVDLEPDGFAVVSMSDLNEALQSGSAHITLIKDILELPQARSKTVERRKQGYRVARDMRDQSYKRRLVVLESGDPVGLLISASLAAGDSSQLLEHAVHASRQRFVNVDFASVNDPLKPLDHALPLQAGQTYYFYLQIGDTPAGLDEKPAPLPADLPAEAELEVVVFGYAHGLHVMAEAGRGRIRLGPDGTSIVTRQAAPPALLGHNPVPQNRLYFPVDTPPEAGEYRLRCLIYYQQALVQARIISAWVGTEPGRRRGPAISSHIDYALSHTLDPSQLSHMAETRLSLFMNDNKDGTHSIAVQGRDLPESPPLHLGDLIVKSWANNIRGDLREAAWGDRENFAKDKMNNYRYPVNALGDLDRLQADLIRLAISGYRIYTDIALKLGTAAQEELAQLLQQTSEVQFSAVENVTSVVPVAAIYDQPLDSSYAHDLTKYGLCDTFKQAFEQRVPLEETECFQGQCPSFSDDRIVCPSGFWGYRHNLGLPVSVGQAPLDAVASIPSAIPAGVSVALSNAEDLRMRDRHKNVLSTMQASWEYHDSHEEVIEMLQKTEAQIVYFYCHGGFDEKSNAPFLSFEQDSDGPRFYPDILQTKDINWPATNPLVFINGCYTTALDPEKTMNFVDRFVQFSRAAGVIGTEITIFESTAMIFAKQFFERFLIKRQPVGEAVRGARLSLLEAGTPFGLVYIPFVLPALKLEDTLH